MRMASSVPMQDDLMNFGKLILKMSSPARFHGNVNSSMEYVFKHYSIDVVNLIRYLLAQPTPSKSVDDLIFKLGHRILLSLNSCVEYSRTLEEELSRELENSRLVRLMCQLGFVNERPE
jgi:PAB-dependent poly(A)-specific ribonuclease subunit 3